MEIKFHARVPNFTAPLMIAAWPGMGNVALNAVDYVRGKLGAKLFAEISTKGIHMPDSVIVKRGVAEFPESPKNLFFYRVKPPVVFVEGQSQFSGKEASLLINKTMDLAAELGVKRILTGAAFPVSASYNQPSRVYVAATKNSLLKYFSSHGLKVLNAGQISGLNGLMLGFARAKGIEAACLLATLPQYAIGLPSPRASRAIVRAICKVLGVTVDLTEMNQEIREMDVKMAAIEDKMKELFPGTGLDETIDLGSDRVPSYVMEKIERLFREVEKEKEKAPELKQELDRWDLYEFYEDRFLDLFKREQ